MDMAIPVTGRRPALKVLTARVTGGHSTVLVGLLSLLLGAFTGLPKPEAVEQDRAAQIESLRQCPSVVSADNRLLTERWAASEDCEKPLRTRVTDRFLGFTCTEGLSDTVACRAFLPLPGSRAFDTSRYFRCVDLGVTDTEFGVVFSKMREWAEFSKACDWSRSRELSAMEVDFVTGRTCVTPGGLCFPVRLLSPIGKVRLRLSIEKALREFGLVRSGRLGTDAYPVPAHCDGFEARRMRRGHFATLPEFSTGLESKARLSLRAGSFTARFSLARHMRGAISPEIRLIGA